MAEKNGKLHIHHRQRLKNRFLKEGLENFEPHNILELLLFFGIPQGDTNDIAHELINNFGNVAGVLDAQYDELVKVKGVGTHTATMIKFMQSIIRVYVDDKHARAVSKPYTVHDAACHLLPYYLTKKVEVVRAMFFDNRMVLVDDRIIFEGSVNSAHVPFQSVIQFALNRSAPNVIIAHNHPNGTVMYSTEDVDTTKKMREIFENLGVNLVEHIVIAGNTYTRILQSIEERFNTNK